MRIDTAGEVIGQGGVPFDGRLHWTGPGVTVELVHAVRRALDTNGFESVHIVLSSGFGDPEKIRAFLEGERKHGRLFEAVGLGSVYQARYATADIVRIEGKDLAKTGRERRDNPRLTRRI